MLEHESVRPTLLIIAAEDIIIRNILDTDVWQLLQSTLVHVSPVLVVPSGRSAEIQERFGTSGIEVREFRRGTPARFDALVATLLYAALPTHTNHWSKMRAYYRGQSGRGTAYLKRFHAMTLGRSHGYRRFLRSAYLQWSDTEAQTLFDDIRPALVIALSVTNFEADVILMREAKRRGIRIVGMTRSWDNLTSHGALRVVPHHLIVQNEFLKDAARGVQGIREQDASIEVVGLPHYDVALDIEQYVGTREIFCAHYGLDPTKKIVLYGAMGTLLFVRENDLPEIFGALIDRNKFTMPLEVLYRQHPKFLIGETAQSFPGIHIDRDANIRNGVDERSASQELFRAIQYADVVVTAASTFAIDAALLDKPIVCVAFDGNADADKVCYWESVRRFYDRYTHFEELLAQDGVRLAYTADALAEEVNRYLTNPLLEQEGRAKIVRRFVGEVDGRASRRLSAVLGKEIDALG